MFPPIEQFQRARRAGNFVTEIIGPAAIRIDVVKMLVQRFGEKPRYDVEILVVVSRQPARVLLRHFERAARLRRVPRDVDFAGAQHQKRESPCMGMSAKGTHSGPPRKADPTKSKHKSRSDSSQRLVSQYIPRCQKRKWRVRVVCTCGPPPHRPPYPPPPRLQPPQPPRPHPH